MSTQIAVRLPDELVGQVDALVRSGHISSRAELVTRALRRELRRERAVADLERLAPDDPELDAITATSYRTPLDLE